MSSLRVALAQPTVLTHVWEVGETPTDPDADTTVTVTDPAGATVQTGTADQAAAGTYTIPLDGQTALTDLQVAWSATIAGAAVVQYDQVAVVGSRFFSLAQGRASDASLSDPAKYTTADLELARGQTEAECEQICDRAMVPAYARMTLDGTGHSDLVLSHPDPDRTVAHVRRIVSATMAPRLDETWVPLTDAQLAALRVTPDGTLCRLDGDAWIEGYANIIVELEYGLTTPPVDLVKAALTRFRTWLNLNKTQIPDRASSFTATDGGVYRLDLPGPWKTGIPSVDAVYSRYSRRSGAGPNTGRPVPASRTLNYDPQFTSLVHQGRR